MPTLLPGTRTALKPALLKALVAAGVSPAQLADWQRPETLALFVLSGLPELPGMETVSLTTRGGEWEQAFSLAARIVGHEGLFASQSWFELLLRALQEEDHGHRP